MRVLCEIAGIPVYQDNDGRVYYVAGATIDADGANGQSKSFPDGRPLYAYAPHDYGLDLLRNAGYPDNPRAYRDILVCSGGHPILHNGSGYISRTAYEDTDAPPNSAQRYLDSVSVHYTVVNPLVRRHAKGVVLGCKSRVSYLGLSDDCVAGDIGPATHLGELSIAAANAIGIDANPRTGGRDKHDVLYEFWPGTPATVKGKTYRLIPA